MHKTLERQIRKFLQNPPPSEMNELFEAISTTYAHFDEDRVLTERSFDLSSRELMDITKKIEEKVEIRTREFQQEHARLLALINNFPLGIILIDADNKIVVRNDRVSSILNIEKSNYTLDDLVSYFPAEAGIGRSCSTCLVEQKSAEVKDISIGKKFIRLIITPIFAKGQNQQAVFGSLFIVEDVTEQKIIERSKDEFFSIASHELRTPLTAIKWNASMLRNYYPASGLNGEIGQVIDDIESASARLIRIVNDFLDMSHLEQKKIKLKEETFDLSETISTVIAEFQEVASRKHIVLAVGKMEMIPLITADKDRFRQILVNLIGNAINYTHEGSISVSLRKQGNFAKIYVTDTGVGIPLKNQSLLFRKFQQAGESTLIRDVSQSTGLGLYISKLIVERMGGSIALEESIPGKGSTFSFTLPLARNGL